MHYHDQTFLDIDVDAKNMLEKEHIHRTNMTVHFPQIRQVKYYAGIYYYRIHGVSFFSHQGVLRVLDERFLLFCPLPEQQKDYSSRTVFFPQEMEETIRQKILFVNALLQSQIDLVGPNSDRFICICGLHYLPYQFFAGSTIPSNTVVARIRTIRYEDDRDYKLDIAYSFLNHYISVLQQSREHIL